MKKLMKVKMFNLIDFYLSFFFFVNIISLIFCVLVVKLFLSILSNDINSFVLFNYFFFIVHNNLSKLQGIYISRKWIKPFWHEIHTDA